MNRTSEKKPAHAASYSNEVKYRAVKVLRAAKKYLTLRELSYITGLAPSLLSRYINGRLTPNPLTSERILDSILAKDIIAGLLLKKISTFRVGEGNIYDISLAAGDPELLYLIGEYVDRDSGSEFDAIVTPEVGGITFATSASIVSGKRLLVLTRNKPAEGGFIEIPVVRNPAYIEYYYVREKDLEGMKKVIIIDDFSVRGSTIKSIITALEGRGITVSKVYLVVGLGGEWKSIPQAHAILELSF